MSNRKYPRPGYDGVIKKNAACKLCQGAEKVQPFVVQINYFRGDDEVFPVCKPCWSTLSFEEKCRRLGLIK